MPTGLLAGPALGFVVAAQVGPIWLLCARTTLRVGAASGLAIGTGAALVDLAYAALGAAGVAPLLPVPALRLALGGRRRGAGGAGGADAADGVPGAARGGAAGGDGVAARAALRTGLLATASNPATIASWAAVFGAASAGQAARGAVALVALVAGIGLGSLAWHAVLAGGLRLLRRRVGDRTLRTVDGLAGTVLVAGGVGLGVRALRAS